MEVKEFYPEKNPHECKIKKDYGNKAYQDGKDIDALHFYTQVSIQMEYIHKYLVKSIYIILFVNRLYSQRHAMKKQVKARNYL